MTDLAAIIQSSTVYAWLYLPVAIILGALHALEPGHAKSLMAAYIVAIRGTAGQAVTLGISAAIGHTIVVWVIAISALTFGQRYVVDQAEPWITVLSGVLIVLLAVRMLWSLRHRQDHTHRHSHEGHDHHHRTHHGHSHEPVAVREGVTTGQIIWFGFTGGLMPCPAALAVLLICIQLKAFSLGVAMVAAFSVGVGATLVTIGLAVVWSAGKLSKTWPGFDRLAQRLPYLSAALVMVIGLLLTVAGLHGAVNVVARKPN
ncbi:MAG TPA: sulfite exporter TauE/SafE family protein [Pseudolabrys sp.]|jgi:nickel/cobalt exporter